MAYVLVAPACFFQLLVELTFEFWGDGSVYIFSRCRAFTPNFHGVRQDKRYCFPAAFAFFPVWCRNHIHVFDLPVLFRHFVVLAGESDEVVVKAGLGVCNAVRGARHTFFFTAIPCYIFACSCARIFLLIMACCKHLYPQNTLGQMKQNKKMCFCCYVCCRQ